MSVINSFVRELRERRLWPVVAVLLVAIVAAPLVLAKSPAPVPVQAPPAAGLLASGRPASPSISVAAPNLAPPGGPAHNPFSFPASATAQSGSAGGSASTGSGSTAAGGSTSGAAPTAPSAGGATGSAPTTTGTPTPGPTSPTTPPAEPAKPAPTGLTATEAYHVTLAITNSAGGLDTIDPLERLSVLPGQRHQLLVDLGVLQGGRRVLFAVQPGAVVTGPGSCAPGPIDCQVLSLAPGQTETLSSANGAVSHVLFAVTAVTADQYPSDAAADKARGIASAEGRKLLSASTLSALSLFPYDPTLGAVVDLRNLSVGG